MVNPDPSHLPVAARPASLWRDVLVIVIAGAALGVGFNVLQGLQRPENALPWLRLEPRLVSLESLASVPPPATSADSSATPRIAPGDSTVPPPARPRALPAVVSPPVAAPTPSLPTVVTPPVPGGAGATVGLPASDLPPVPQTREPLEVGLEFAKRFHAARGAVFVDARSTEEYAAGHIPGATSMPFDEVFRRPELARGFDDRGLPLFVYCGGGDCDLSRSLAYTLIDNGHKRVLVFKDGLAGWSAAGLAVATGSQP